MRPRTSITGTISVILITALLTPEVQGATDTRTATLESVYTTNTVRTINNVKRGDPVESRADFFGYLLLNDGTFSAGFCYQGETITTIGTLVGCCPQPGLSCEFGITCSRGYAVRTVLESPAISKTRKHYCNGGMPGLYDCITTTVYQSEITSFPAAMTPPLVRVGCGMHIVGNTYPSYYLTLTPGAEVTISTPAYPAGQPASTTSIYVPPIASSKTTSFSEPGQSPSMTAAPNLTTGNPSNPSQSNSGGPSSESSGDNNNPSTTSKSGQPSSGGPREGQGEGNSDSSESSASLSRSDQIAIGIGIGLGFPTVLIGVLAWFYPRYRPQIPGHQASTKSRLWPRHASAAPAPDPAPAPAARAWEEMGAAGVGVGGGHGSAYLLTPLPTRTAPEIITGRVDLNNGGAGVP